MKTTIKLAISKKRARTAKVNKIFRLRTSYWRGKLTDPREVCISRLYEINDLYAEEMLQKKYKKTLFCVAYSECLRHTVEHLFPFVLDTKPEGDLRT